jgi:hypothetical protein
VTDICLSLKQFNIGSIVLGLILFYPNSFICASARIPILRTFHANSARIPISRAFFARSHFFYNCVPPTMKTRSAPLPVLVSDLILICSMSVSVASICDTRIAGIICLFLLPVLVPDLICMYLCLLMLPVCVCCACYSPSMSVSVVSICPQRRVGSSPADPS